jgi:ArsR family metal-binding transcriptional regulator
MSPSTNKLIENFDTELFSPACHPGSEHWSIKLTLKHDISEVLPYLNAELDGADYDHNANVLVWKDRGRKYAFRPHEIKAGPIQDRDEVDPLSRETIELVNDVWNRKDTIEPDYERKRVPPVMEIYKRLPKINCKECGYETCMAFAAALRDYKAELCECTELTKEQYSEALRQLEQLFEGS